MKHALYLVAYAIIAALVLYANTAPAEHVPEPILLRFTGFVASAPEGEKTLGTLTLGIDHAVTTVELAAVQMLNGPLTEGPAALRAFELYNPNLLCVGSRKLLDSIRAAPPRRQITVFGYLRGPRRLLVVEVQPE